MKQTIYTLTSATLFSFAPLVHAGAGWTDYATVTEFVATSQQYYYFKLPVKENPSGCRDKVGFYQDYGTKGADSMFKTMLEGIKPGLRVRVYVTGNCNLDGYSEISSVSISP